MDGCHSFSNLSYGTGDFCCSKLDDVLELHRFLSVKIWGSVEHHHLSQSVSRCSSS